MSLNVRVFVCVVSCSWVSKVYRLPTETDCWMLVKEKMSESPLTFHIPTLLLDNLIKEEKARCVCFGGLRLSSS